MEKFIVIFAALVSLSCSGRFANVNCVVCSCNVSKEEGISNPSGSITSIDITSDRIDITSDRIDITSDRIDITSDTQEENNSVHTTNYPSTDLESRDSESLQKGEVKHEDKNVHEDKNASHYEIAPDTLNEQHLNEVIVKGQRPEIKSTDGVMSVDLSQIVKDRPVTNILESLSYIPGVINQNGTIGLSGTSSTTICINGEPSQMNVEQLYQLLYSIPIERLKNIEIMYSAPAKYHVVGALINIVLKTPSVFDGLQGQGRIGYDQSHYASYGGGLSAVYAIKRWSFDLDYSLSNSHTFQGEDITSRHSLKDRRYKIEDENRSSKKALANLIHSSITYNLAANSKVNLIYNAQIKDNATSDNSSVGTLGSFLNRSTFDRPIELHNFSLNYKSSFGLTVNADYLTYRERRNQIMSDLKNSEIMVDSKNAQRINRYKFTADMEHDIKGWTFGYGASYNGTDDHSSMTYAVPDNPGFSNSLKEHTAKIYLSMSHTFSWGLSFQTSIGEELYGRDGTKNFEGKIERDRRVNNTVDYGALGNALYLTTRGPSYLENGDVSVVNTNPKKNHWIFCPQIGMTYFRNPRHILQLNFSTRRDYPSYWELHGGVGYLNPYSEIWGNPLLKPSTTYEGTLSYIFLQKYVATFFLNDFEDYSVQLPYQSPEELKLIFQTINTNFNRKIGLVLNAPFSLGEWFDTRIMLQGYYAKERADHFQDISFSRNKMTGFAMAQNTFKVAKGLSLTLDICGITPSLQGIGDISGMWKVDAGAKWSFGKNSCCELTLMANDIFNTWNPILRINYDKQNYRMATKEFTRNLRVAFVYRFNEFKPKENSGDSDLDTFRFGTK